MRTLGRVGQGTALAGRYRLEERLRQTSGSAFWRALDQSLDRSVGVRVLDGRTAEDALDAGRRAILVQDARLLRVLDVGAERGAAGPAVTYVVSELVDGISLADLLNADGPMPADQVRALVGEAALALEHARVVGLHHRVLTPACVLRTRDGSVKVSGVAVDAAAGGVDDESPAATAARQDAVALVAVLYAGMTARWPFGDVDGLLAAPQVFDLPVPPAEVVPGVPNDLDTLCSVTFGPHDDGPRTPGEVAEQLAPWGPRGRVSPGATPGRTPAAAASAPKGTALPAPAKTSPAAGRSGSTVLVASPASKRTQDVGRRVADLARSGVRLAGAARDRARTAWHVAATAAATPAAAGTGSTSGSTASGTAATIGRTYRDTWDVALGRDVRSDGTDEDPDAPASQSRVVLAVVAALLVIGLVLAVNSLSGIGDGQAAAPRPAPPAAATTPAPEVVEPAPTKPPPKPSTPPPTIAGVRTLDPQGGDGENDETAPRAIDDDPESFWNSSTYGSAEFGGLKDGLGMVVSLTDTALVSGVTVDLNGEGGTVELRAAPSQGFDGSTVVATADIAGEPVDFALEAPFETEHLVLWWTELPEAGDGYKIELTQVQVR